MKITLLGTGTSQGVPVMGCQCRVCQSDDPRDKRLRCSALVSVGAKNILIDCGPDFRQQMLRIHSPHIDAILITHEHYDHVGGLDDLRPHSFFHDVDVFADSLCASHLRNRLPYCFLPADQRYPGVPGIRMHEVTPFRPFLAAGVEVLPLRLMHGQLPILGFRIGSFAYITDASAISSQVMQCLKGVDTMVINGLRHTPHPSHQTIEQAVDVATQAGVESAYITHLCHETLLYEEEEQNLPKHVHLAYDGLTLMGK